MDSRSRALEDVYRRRYRGFRNAVASIVGDYDTAQDVVQEAFARALAHCHSFRGDGTLEAWVWQIAVRVAQNHRPFGAYDELEDLGFLEPERDPALAAVVRALPPRRRLVIFLRYFAELTYAEIASVCEISEGTVAATLAQAHQQLQKTLAPKEEDDAPDRQAHIGA